MKRDKQTLAHRFTVVLSAIVLFGIALAGLILPDETYSYTERRVLAQQPALTAENLASGKYMSAFESYAMDQFPLRDSLRIMKARFNKYVLGERDNHGYYLAQGYLSKLEYPMNTKRLQSNLAKQQQVYDKYIAGTDCRIYYSIIPDKNYFLAAANGYPVMDYNAYVELVQQGVNYGTYIDVFDTLSLDAFYRTDQHIRQEAYGPLVEKLGVAMGRDFQRAYNEMLAMEPFYGAYFSQAALPCEGDRIICLTNDMLEQCTVTSYNTGVAEPAKLYDFQKAKGNDSYEVYLGGADAFLVVENPNAASDKELVLFRDSFGSSIAPLLVGEYAKVTLVDLRYVQVNLLGQLFAFDNQDVLFLYSSLVY